MGLRHSLDESLLGFSGRRVAFETSLASTPLRFSVIGTEIVTGTHSGRSVSSGAIPPVPVITA
ncbi:hypothetical protein, partial [Mesorhizobium marinum]|uniref:hypothetical protein n=1 Tax=Mesorhizobium marinum TaxID=3228790 RepID=UPI0034677EDA